MTNTTEWLEEMYNDLKEIISMQKTVKEALSEEGKKTFLKLDEMVCRNEILEIEYVYREGFKDGLNFKQCLTGPSLLDENTAKKWEHYAKNYNSLSDKLAETGIDVQLLINVTDALKEVYER